MNSKTDRNATALYWMAWSLKECDGMPIELIATRLEKTPAEILDLLLTYPGRNLHTADRRKFLLQEPAKAVA